MTPWRTVAGADGGRWWRLDADGPADLLDRPPSSANYAAARSLAARDAARGAGARWWGVESMGRATAILRGAEPWTEGVTRAEALRGRIEVPRGASVRRRRAWGPEGDSLDVDRALAGAWDAAWARTAREAVAGATRTLTIYVQAGLNASVDASAYAWTGVVAGALVDALESAGYSVGVTLVAAATDVYQPRGDAPVDSLITWPIKAAGEPLNLAQIVGWTGLAAVDRIAMFGATLGAPARARSNFGRTADARQAWESLYGEAEPGAIWLPAFYDAADAAEYLAKTVAEHGPDGGAALREAEAERERADAARWAQERVAWDAGRPAREAAERERVAAEAAAQAAETAAERRARVAAERAADKQTAAWDRAYEREQRSADKVGRAGGAR